MTKARDQVVADAPVADAPAADAPAVQPSAGPADEMVEVKFIGPERAILGGAYILHNETRRTSRAIVAAAERTHPGEFKILSGV